MADYLQDRREIIDLIVRYGWAVDDHDLEELRNIFVPDGEISYLGHPMVGIDNIIRTLTSMSLSVVVVQHLYTNHLVTVDGDIAVHRSQNMQIQSNTRKVDEANYLIGGKSRTELVRTEAGWRIKKRTTEQLWTRGAFDPTLD